MTENDIWKFHIDGKTPKTILAKELFACMTALLSDLSNEDTVIFKEVIDESACPVFEVPCDQYDIINDKFNSAKTKKNVNKVLTKIKTSARVECVNKDNIVYFKGINKIQEKPINVFQKKTIRGKVHTISGRDNTANIKITDIKGKEYPCEIDEENAKKLTWGTYISALTEGEFERSITGGWVVPKYKKLKIISFEKISYVPTEELFNEVSNLISDETFGKIQNEIKLNSTE